MNNYASLRKQNNGTALAVVALAMCVVLSGTVLFSRLMTYTQADPCHYIPLTRSDGSTTVTTDGQLCQLGGPVLLTYSPVSWSPVEEGGLTWVGETPIELFRTSYENGEGQVTVNSQNGDKVLAPGTSNSYSFALQNTSPYNLDYEMNMEAYVSDGETIIPVVVRVSCAEGEYLAGSPDSFVAVQELNGVRDTAVLTAGYIMRYTLEWEWPFELDDEYDTMLGSLSEEASFSLTIVINTSATYTEEAGGGEEPPKTGDMGIGLMASVMVFSGAGLLYLLLLLPKRKGETDENT